MGLEGRKLRGEDTGFGEPGYCPQCGVDAPEGPDPCLGEIPGVSHACCGHGIVEPYVVLGGQPGQDLTTFDEHLTLRGMDAETFFEIVRRARQAARWMGDPEA